MRVAFAAVMMTMALGFGLQPAQAVSWRHWKRPPAPWCAVYTVGWGVHWDCSYATLEACVPFVIAGNRGFCNPNPYYPGPVEARPGRHRHR